MPGHTADGTIPVSIMIPILIFRHRIQLSVHRSLPGGLDISAYWEFHSGQPYCPGAYYAYIPYFYSPHPSQYNYAVWCTAYNMDVSRDKIRYPCYHRLDIQFSWTARYKYATLYPYFSIYNAYVNKNVLYYRSIRF